ncbi:hypothetical protein PR048_008249 [Dryococelus australis]|uniref:Uncharacterized protein n=1 Tax=Dryococelus australis TaxID=614101 RepID=A0ABQ9HWX1_9NEOP|nr:hypothetical protein PR048_008249 [Dryococelus australis]
MEQRRNEGAGETEDPRENPPTSGIVWHDFHLRKSGVNRPWIEPGSSWWEASSLTAQLPGQTTHLLPMRTVFDFQRGRSRIVTCGNRAGQCRWSAGFLGDLPFPPPFHSVAAPYPPRLTLICSQNLNVKNCPNLFTHSLTHTRLKMFYCPISSADGASSSRAIREVLSAVQQRRPRQLWPEYCNNSTCRLRKGAFTKGEREKERERAREREREPGERVVEEGMDKGYWAISHTLTGDKGCARPASRHCKKSAAPARQPPSGDVTCSWMYSKTMRRQVFHSPYLPISNTCFCACLFDLHRTRRIGSPQNGLLHNMLDIYVPSTARYPTNVRYGMVLAEHKATARLPQRRTGFNPRPVHSGFSQVGIVPVRSAGRRAFLGNSHLPPPLHSGTTAFSPHFTLVGSQDLDIKNRLNLPTPHSLLFTLQGDLRQRERERERERELVSACLALHFHGLHEGYWIFLRAPWVLYSCEHVILQPRSIHHCFVESESDLVN